MTTADNPPGFSTSTFLDRAPTLHGPGGERAVRRAGDFYFVVTLPRAYDIASPEDCEALADFLANEVRQPLRQMRETGNLDGLDALIRLEREWE